MGYDVNVSGDVAIPNFDLYKDLVSAKIDVYNDCDFDCQKGGSGMTLIATLMSTMYSLIMLNACCMCCGLFDYRNRVFSLYCTLFNCMFQLIITIVCCVFLFTKYNALCARSIASTGPLEWNMADDFYVTSTGVITSFIYMCCFCGCGMRNGEKPQ